MSLQWSLTDLDSEDGNGRNQMGETFKDRISQKRQLSCSLGSHGGREDEKSSLLSSTTTF